MPESHDLAADAEAQVEAIILKARDAAHEKVENDKVDKLPLQLKYRYCQTALKMFADKVKALGPATGSDVSVPSKSDEGNDSKLEKQQKTLKRTLFRNIGRSKNGNKRDKSEFDASYNSNEVESRLKLSKQAIYHLHRAVKVTVLFKLHKANKQPVEFGTQAGELRQQMLSVEDNMKQLEDIIFSVVFQKMAYEEQVKSRMLGKKENDEKVRIKFKRRVLANKKPKVVIYPDEKLPKIGETVPAGKFVEFEVYGDGSCAFRSIVQGLRNGTLTADEEEQAFPRLRQFVCRQLTAKANTKTPSGMTLWETMQLNLPVEMTLTAYVKKMMTCAYAGETELFLVAEGLKKRISVYRLNKAKHSTGRGTTGTKTEYMHMMTYGETGQRIFLLWSPGRSESGNHYDLLLPVIDQKPNAEKIIPITKRTPAMMKSIAEPPKRITKLTPIDPALVSKGNVEKVDSVVESANSTSSSDSQLIKDVKNLNSNDEKQLSDSNGGKVSAVEEGADDSEE